MQLLVFTDIGRLRVHGVFACRAYGFARERLVPVCCHGSYQVKDRARGRRFIVVIYQWFSIVSELRDVVCWLCTPI